MDFILLDASYIFKMSLLNLYSAVFLMIYYSILRKSRDPGYMLLSGKVRSVEEETVIRTVLETVFKRKIEAGTVFDGSLVPYDFRNVQVCNLEIRQLQKP